MDFDWSDLDATSPVTDPADPLRSSELRLGSALARTAQNLSQDSETGLLAEADPTLASLTKASDGYDGWTPSYNSTTLDDVIVTGTREEEDDRWWLDYDWDGDGGPSGDPAGQPDPVDGSWPPPDPDVQPPVTNDGSPDAVAAAATLAQAVAAADDVIDGLADTAVITLANGQTMTGAQIKAIWNSMSFHVTTGVSYGSGRGGANSGGLIGIDAGTINGYGAWGADGLNFLLAHEIAHNTAAGSAANQSFWNQHLAAGGNTSNYMPGTTGFFELNETFANSIARSIAAAAGLPIPTGGGFPPHGY